MDLCRSRGPWTVLGQHQEKGSAHKCYFESDRSQHSSRRGPAARNLRGNFQAAHRVARATVGADPEEDTFTVHDDTPYEQEDRANNTEEVGMVEIETGI